MKLIISYIRRHLGIFMTSMLFLTMEAFADLLQPTFMAHIVDDGVKNADTSRIFYYGYVSYRSITRKGCTIGSYF